MKKSKTVNTYVDTLGIRCECDNITQRDSLFNAIFDFLKEKKLVGTKYNEDRSSPYYQMTELLYGNTRLASIAKGYYVNDTSFNPDYYYINISFYGLKRYSKIKDEASTLLVRIITAFLNTYNIDFRLIELDIAMDIESKINNILAVCISRSPNVEYYELGDFDENGEEIQDDKGTYNIEKYKSKKSRKNAMGRAYLYDKRKKEKDKYKRELGFDLTRFEVKLQKRWFVKNEFGFIPIYKALQKYVVLELEDLQQKEQLIQKINSAKTSRQRRTAIHAAIKDNSTVSLTQKMNLVGAFLREIDTIKFDNKGELVFTKHEDYLESMSKFNRK